MSKEPILCYVESNFAYFTTQDLKKQQGDDWNDAPYEHNAGTPYSPNKSFLAMVSDSEGNIVKDSNGKAIWREGTEYINGNPPWEIIKIVWSGGDFETPEEGHTNSPYSVEDINAGAVAWLYQKYKDAKISIIAGTTITDFIKLIEKGGGEIFLNREQAYRFNN